ncbi:MAG: IPTL-CTERM sorting domain-containing protein [Gallionellaceae bacterium]
MNAQSALTTQSRHGVPRVAQADSRFSRIYRGLLASLGVAFLLVSAPAMAATAPPLGLVQQFGVLGAAGVTAAGIATINGDVGSYPTPSITGFPPSTATAPFTVHYSADAVVQQAQTDATAASVNLTGQGAGATLPDDLTGQTITPGTYSFATGTPNLPAGATLTLNDPSPGKTGIFVFNVATSLTTISTSIVAGTANPCNIYWNITSAATLGDDFWGNVIAGAGVTVGTGATLTGRAVSLTAAVTMPGTGQRIQGCSALVTPAVATPAAGQVGLSKAFFPSTIAAGGVSRLAITLMNNTGIATALTAPLTDTLPGGMVIAPTPNASTTCGGVVTAVPGTNTVTLAAAGSTIPGFAGPLVGSCTVMVNVTAPTGGSFLNTLAVNALQTTGGINNLALASATLTIPSVSGIPTLSKWAIIILAALLAIGSFAAMRRRQAR